MKALVEYIASSLVDDPSQVVVKQERSGSKVVLQLRVAKADMGRIIGKNGKVANSIRILLRVAAAREGKQVSLDVIEPK
ncbi:MAG: KH domain-containing protein [Anaerolineae bacterium]|nr:KH domain-containing protein [Anaerolineae bacterium]